MKKIFTLVGLVIFVGIQGKAQPGSGNAVSFTGNDIAQITYPSSLFYFSNSVEFWIKIGDDYNQANDESGRVEILSKMPYGYYPSYSYGFCLSYLTNKPTNGTSANRILFERFGYQGLEGPSYIISDFPVNDNKYHHISLRKYDMFIDGILQNTAATGVNTLFYNSGDYQPINLGRGLLPGTNPTTFFIDELRIWNRQLSENEVRERMCRKITGTDPISGQLHSYYKFDELSGNQIINEGFGFSLMNGNLPAGAGRHISAAPVGDTSVYVYSTIQIPSNSLQLNGQDQLSVNYSNAAYMTSTAGSHIYAVRSKPNTENGITGAGSNDRYFGIFNAGLSAASYTATYQYSGNPYVTIADEEKLRLFKRDDNADPSWSNSGVLPNTSSNHFTVNGNYNTELVLGTAVYDYDEPCTAFNLTPGLPGLNSCATPMTGDVSNASFNPTISVCNVSTNDLWYWFTATRTSHIIKATGNGDFQPAISIYGGSSCNTLNAGTLGCAGNSTEVSLPLSGLTPGATYFIRVCSSIYLTPANTSFSICVLTPDNDEPCTATLLSPGSAGVTTCTNPVQGDVSLATNSGLATNTNSSGQIFYNNDLWYKFVATQSTCLVRLDQDGDFRSAVNLYSSSDCSNVGARLQNDKSFSALHIARYTGLVAGNTYYLQVSRRDTANSSTTFSICLLTPALNDEICGAIDLPNSQPLTVGCSNAQSGDWNFGTSSSTGCLGSNPDFWYKFTATHTTHVIKTSNVADMAVYQASSCNGPLNLLTCRGTGFTIDQQKAVPLNNLVIGNTYYVAIGRFTSVNNSTFSICQAAVPNDDPCGAVSLSNCSVIPVDVAFGTNTLSGTCQSVTPRDTIIFGAPQQVYDQIRLNDLWYTFTATEPYAELLLSGTAFTGLFKLYPTIRLSTFGDCNNLNTVNIIQDCRRLINPTAQMTVPFSGLTIGQTYYIAISNGNRDFSETLRTDFNMEFRQGQSSVAITVDPSGPVCLGTPVTFTATTTNGGANPQLNWFVNNVLSGSGTTFSSASLQNNDVVTCALTSSNCVAPPTVGQSITMNIYPVPTWYQDADGDGFGGVNAVSTTTCVQPAGYVLSNTDCDDTDPTVYPGSVNPRPFRTRQNGSWGSSLTWESFDGCNWIAGGIPTAADSTILINHEITIAGGTTVNANQIIISTGARLTINGKLNLVDAPGPDLFSNAGSFIYMNEGGSLTGNGQVESNGQSDVYAAFVIAVPFINNGVFYFARYTQGCCPGGLINLTDGLTFGKIENYGTFYVIASTGISLMNIANGEFYNRPQGTIHMEYKTAFSVNKFTNEGELFLAGSPAAEYTCTVNSTQGATHRGRIRSGDNNKKFVMQTNGTFTYAADCVIDANMHYASGTHEIFSTSYGAYDTRVSTTVNCMGADKHFPGNVSVDAGDFGGPAIKSIGGTIFWPSGMISGGNLVINSTARAEIGAGQASLGILSTALVNNGVVNVFNYNGGCCNEPALDMTNGSIQNNGQFIFSPTGGGGVRNVTLSGGTFNNNAAGTLVNNATVVSTYGDNEIYLRNAVFTNNGTILANGKSLNIFPTTNPVINGTITIASGGQVKLGIPSTTTTISSNAVINGAGTVYFFEGNHQVNTAFYNVGGTSIGLTYSAANVYFNAPSVELNYVYMTSGVLGGAATKLIKDDMVFINGQITGGPISNTDTSVFHYGAGNTNLGAMNTAFTNNGVVEVSSYHPGCCSEPVINLTGGSITNNGTFNVTGSGGIRYVGISNGAFTNNAGAVINSNIGDVAFGEPSFRMQPASFTNNGTINVLRNIMELGNFTVGGDINVSPNTVLRSTGTITFNGSLINNNGNISAPFNFQNTAVKTLKGNGVFSSNIALNSAATVTPGSSPGILTVLGNYTQGNAALEIEIGGTVPGTGYDRLAVTGSATISGTLNAVELPGFTAQGLTTLDIITAGAVTGTFSQVNLPPFWSVQYAANKVSLVKFFEFVYYRDADNDGYGNPADTIRRVVTTPPAGYTTDSRDCNDNNAAINPLATEICDGLDNNCDGIVDTVYMPGLILYMPLNGNANDLSTNGLHGTINGSVTATTDRFGNAGAAMSFPGNVNSHIRINDQPLLRPSSITLSAWVRMSSQPGITGFINKSINCYNDSWHFGSQGGNYSTWISNSTNCGDLVQMTSPLSLGNWRHIVFTLDDVADTRRMYVDGNLVATGAYTSSIPYDGNPVLIGAAIENGNLDFPFHGSLDDVMIFNRAITAAEVTTLFTQGSPVQALNARYYADADGDGFGNPSVSQLACSQPSGYVLDNTDCNDNSAAAYPGATEVCDGIDNNCDGFVDMVSMPGLILYMPMNGNATDLSGNGLNGTINGTVTPVADRLGNANGAMRFSGSVNSHISIADQPLLRPSSISLGAWVKINSQTNLTGFISKSINCINDSWHFGSQDGNYSTWVSNSTSCGDFVQMTSTLSIGNWRHVVFTLDAVADIRKMYIDGILVASGAYTSSIPYDGNPVLIGAAIENGSLAFPLNGDLDDVMIFNRAITAGEVSTLFNNSNPIVPLNATYYADADGDGFGNPTVTATVNCGSPAPTGYVSNNTDCNDANANIYPGVSAGTISGASPLNVSQSGQFTSNGVPGGVWNSSNPAVASVNPVSGLLSAVSPGSVNITYTISTCTGTDVASFSLTVNPNETPGIVSGASTLCIGSTTLFSSTGTPGGTWSSSNTQVATIDPVTGLVTGLSGGLVNIIYTVGGSQSASASLQVISSPSQNLITSNSDGFVFCIGETRNLNLAFPVTGFWSSSNSAVATVNSTTGLVTAIGGGIADITFTQTNPCGQSTTSRQIRVIPVGGSPVVTGPVNVCAFVGAGTPVKYVATLPGIRLFNWTVPPNVTILSGQNTDTLTVTIASGFTTQANKQIICAPVLDRNCSNINLTSSIYILKSQLPGTPSPIISSLSSVCRGDVITLRIPKVPGASSYGWSLVFPLSTNEAIISHPNGPGENDTLVEVTFTNSFSSTSNPSFTVRAINQCGASSVRQIYLVRLVTPVPSNISGPTNVCEYQAPGGIPANYSVPQQPFVTSYTWTVPSGSIGLTGQGTNSISFVYPSGTISNIAVVANSRCGASLPRTLAIGRLNPGTPSPIDVINTVSCPNREYSYTLAAMPANASSVQWTVPAGGQIISGQGTTSIRVLYGSASINGNVTATAVSNCGSSAARTSSVKLPACPPQPFAPGNQQGNAKGLDVNIHDDSDFQAGIFPNPSVDEFNIRISGGVRNKPAKIRVLDMQGRVLHLFQLMPDVLMKFGRNLMPGVYLVEIEQAGERQVHKIIKR